MLACECLFFKPPPFSNHIHSMYSQFNFFNCSFYRVFIFRLGTQAHNGRQTSTLAYSVLQVGRFLG